MTKLDDISYNYHVKVKLKIWIRYRKSLSRQKKIMHKTEISEK